MKKPYTVKVEKEGCPSCAAGRTWMVVGPDGIGHHTTFDEVECADSVAEDLNAAYEAGRLASSQSISWDEFIEQTKTRSATTEGGAGQ